MQLENLLFSIIIVGSFQDNDSKFLNVVKSATWECCKWILLHFTFFSKFFSHSYFFLDLLIYSLCEYIPTRKTCFSEIYAIVSRPSYYFENIWINVHKKLITFGFIFHIRIFHIISLYMTISLHQVASTLKKHLGH